VTLYHGDVNTKVRSFLGARFLSRVRIVKRDGLLVVAISFGKALRFLDPDHKVFCFDLRRKHFLFFLLDRRLFLFFHLGYLREADVDRRLSY